jgi:hypothetical protein
MAAARSTLGHVPTTSSGGRVIDQPGRPYRRHSPPADALVYFVMSSTFVLMCCSLLLAKTGQDKFTVLLNRSRPEEPEGRLGAASHFSPNRAPDRGGGFSLCMYGLTLPTASLEDNRVVEWPLHCHSARTSDADLWQITMIAHSQIGDPVASQFLLQTRL